MINQPSTITTPTSWTERMARAARKHGKIAAASAAIVAIAAFLVAVLAVPQSFTAATSISMQQNSSAGGGLAALAGLTSGDHKYVGVLRSRRAALEVEDKVHLRGLYKLRDQNAAVEMLQRSLKMEDSATDGLLYIYITLPGPARYMPGQNARRTDIKTAAAGTANAYAAALYRYLAHDFTDKDTALRAAANQQTTQAQAAYDNSVRRLLRYMVKRKPAKSVAVGSSAPTNSSTFPKSESTSETAVDSGGRMQSLYLKRGELEAEIQSAKASQAATDALVSGSPSRLAKIPDEDPLLTQARSAYNNADIAYQNLLIRFGDQHPRVAAAKQQRTLAGQRLRAQATSVLSGNTSTTIKLRALQAEYDEVSRQLSEAEHGYLAGREDSLALERLRNDVSLRFDVLKAAASQSAVIAFQTVSARNRMAVVDPAIPPEAGTPKVSILLIISLFVGLAAGAVTLSGFARAECSAQTPATP